MAGFESMYIQDQQVKRYLIVVIDQFGSGIGCLPMKDSEMHCKEIVIKFLKFSFTKIHIKLSSAKRRSVFQLCQHMQLWHKTLQRLIRVYGNNYYEMFNSQNRWHIFNLTYRIGWRMYHTSYNHCKLLLVCKVYVHGFVCIWVEAMQIFDISFLIQRPLLLKLVLTK